jgi:nucleotide-binding universal stress UspA family protein
MIRDVIFPITNTPGDANAFAAAVALSIQAEAHLDVLEFVDLPFPPTGPWSSEKVGLGEIYAKCRIEAETDAVAWRHRLAKEPIKSEVRVIESTRAESADLAARHVRCSDIAVMTMPTGAAEADIIVRNFFASLLLATGRPLLMIPPRFAWRPVKHAVVAWRPSCEATRALHDALPLLGDAESVDLLEVDSDCSHQPENPPPGGDAAAHLCRHGLKAVLVTRSSHDGSIASALIKHVEETGADLLIAGGYGHSRFREWALGGATMELLSGSCPVPILFSH